MIDGILIAALVAFSAATLLRIWWLLSTWELRRRKLRLEVEQCEDYNRRVAFHVKEEKRVSRS